MVPPRRRRRDCVAATAAGPRAAPWTCMQGWVSSRWTRRGCWRSSRRCPVPRGRPCASLTRPGPCCAIGGPAQVTPRIPRSTAGNFATCCSAHYTGVTLVEASLDDVDTRHPDLARLTGDGSLAGYGANRALVAQRCSTAGPLRRRPSDAPIGSGCDPGNAGRRRTRRVDRHRSRGCRPGRPRLRRSGTARTRRRARTASPSHRTGRGRPRPPKREERCPRWPPSGQPRPRTRRWRPPHEEAAPGMRGNASRC